MDEDPLTTEVWKAIPGFEGVYEVSSFGQVCGVTRTINRSRAPYVKQRALRTPAKGADERYFHVSLPTKYVDAQTGRAKTKSKAYHVHRLVMLAFVGPLPAGMYTRHLDGNSHNNRLDNLCYGTPSENQADRKVHGTDYYPKGSLSGSAKLNEEIVLKIREEFAAGKVYQKDLAVKYGVDASTISVIVHNKNWTHADGPTRQKHNRPLGERCATSKLTRAQVEAIKEEYAAGGIKQKDLGAKYGVKQACVSAIICGYTWSETEGQST